VKLFFLRKPSRNRFGRLFDMYLFFILFFFNVSFKTILNLMAITFSSKGTK